MEDVGVSVCGKSGIYFGHGNWEGLPKELSLKRNLDRMRE